MTCQEQMDAHKDREKPTSRVSALDAVELDSEILRICKGHLLKITHTLSPAWTRWEPELELLLRLVIWKLSVHKVGATFGQQLLSIRYDSSLSRRKTVAWAVFTFGVGYLHKRSSELTALVLPRHRDKVTDWLDIAEAAVQLARLANMVMFLREGRFPDLVDRLVDVQPVSAIPASRVVGYSYMTRELLWHGFVELIVFLLPLVNYSALLRSLRRIVGYKQTKRERVEPLVYTIATRCAVCLQPPTLPYQMGCEHAFCYYCLQSNRGADIKFECPTCGHYTEDSAAITPIMADQCRST